MEGISIGVERAELSNGQTDSWTCWQKRRQNEATTSVMDFKKKQKAKSKMKERRQNEGEM
jgi:hypothetical protein